MHMNFCVMLWMPFKNPASMDILSKNFKFVFVLLQFIFGCFIFWFLFRICFFYLLFLVLFLCGSCFVYLVLVVFFVFFK